MRLFSLPSSPPLLPPALVAHLPVGPGTGMAPIVRDDFFGKAKALFQYVFVPFRASFVCPTLLMFHKLSALFCMVGLQWGQQGFLG